MEGPDERTLKTEDLTSFVTSLAAAARAQQASLKSVDPKWQETGDRIKRLVPEAASLAASAQARLISLEAFDAKWQALMDRFDAWPRGQGGNGRPS